MIARTLLVTVLAGVSAQAQMAGDANVAQRFVGAWRLVSWTQQMADGTSRPAASDTGSIIYTADGRMCAVLQSSKREKWSGPAKTLDDAVARMSGAVSYCARVEVNGKEGFVLHHVDLDFNPNSVGIVRKRWFTFDGPDRLSLSIDPGELQKTVKASVLVWERVKGSK